MMNRNLSRFFLLGVSVLALSACSLVPNYERPGVAVPAAWTQTTSGGVNATADWWTAFGSADLNALIFRALEQNNDLRAAMHRIEQARASLKIAGAPLYPSLDGSGSAGWTHTDSPTAGSGWSDSGRAGVGISYEMDLFGANRAAAESARAGYKGSMADRQTLALTTMADVATTYFTILNLQERVKIAGTNLAIAQDVADIVRARSRAGAATELEESQQTIVVAGAEASLASLREQKINAENAMAILLGQPPQSINVRTANLSDFTVPMIAAGQPSDLLQRRPDIYKAEMDMVGANADIGAARAALYPSVTLGLDWTAAATPFGDPATTALALASALAVPIFSGNRLEGGVERATARQAELAENYRKTVLVAFQEVEDALAGVRAAGERQTSLDRAAGAARKAWSLSRQQYDAGLIDFQALLDAQRSLLSAEDSASTARLANYTAAVTLFRALGGGWDRVGASR